MAIDKHTTPGTRARAEGASNAMNYMISAVVIAGLVAVVMMFACQLVGPPSTVRVPIVTPVSGFFQTEPVGSITKPA